MSGATGREYRYETATSRNIGWLTAQEQQRLREVRVAIAGLGGVGSHHAITAARLGIGRYSLSDFDEYEVHNFNRQAGAFMSTVGRPKLEVMSERLRDINPEADLRCFPEGVMEANVDRFLDGVDLYLDGVDFFALPARRLIFRRCAELGIPALTAAPLGMGVALLYFSPKGMSFEDYFRLEGQPEIEQYARFIAGLSPAMLQLKYLVQPDAVSFADRRGPSTPMACDLCAGVIMTAALQVLLGRNPPKPAPWGLHFDAYRGRLRRTWRPGGNANPIQQLMLALVRPRLHMRAG